MAVKDKDTIYIDVDEEITGVIDKLKNSNGKVVALVLPKRATVFQSIVNMKLLKRAADASKKNTVLITSEAALLPLAGVAGVHVAKTLTSKPYIPLIPSGLTDDDEDAISDQGESIEELPDPEQTVGELAGAAATKPSDEMETLSLDDDTPEADNAAIPPVPPSLRDANKDKKSKNKKLKVPNFDRFRLALILLGVVLVLVIIGFFIANAALAKATITVTTNATKVNTNLNLNLSTSAKTLDQPNATLPAKVVSMQKTYTANTVTTGQKNNGTVASGSVTLTAQYCNGSNPPINGPADVPAGTGLGANGLTYITQADTTFSSNGTFHKGCIYFNANQDTPIKAQTGGASYNGASSFTVAGRSEVVGSAAQAISGGSDNIVQSVNQNDINTAKSKISTTDSSVEQSLVNQLSQSGYDYAVKATYSPGTPSVTSSAPVGTVANSVTVTETITYTLFGVHKADLSTLVTNNIDGQIDSSKQSVLDDGIATATFSVNSQDANNAQLAYSGVAVAGPQLSISSIQKVAAGQKPRDVQTQLQTNPNVTGVTVKLSPFWVSSVPKNNSHIHVIIAKPTSTVKASSNASSQ